MARRRRRIVHPELVRTVQDVARQSEGWLCGQVRSGRCCDSPFLVPLNPTKPKPSLNPNQCAGAVGWPHSPPSKPPSETTGLDRELLVARTIEPGLSVLSIGLHRSNPNIGFASP